MSSVSAPGQVTIEHISTADGGTVACRRLPGSGPPVVLFHGLAVNSELWSLPEVKTPEYHYRSLSTLLQERGFDVWLANFRGHGPPECRSKPPAGMTDWCVDDFILQDVPAIVEHVATRASAPPFVVGASMGAMSLAAFLAGAHRESSNGLTVDPHVARRRQERIAGAVFAEFPAALRWPRSALDDRGRVRWRQVLRDWARTDGEVNYPFEIFARLGWIEAIIAAAGGVRLDWMSGRRREGLRSRLPASIARGLDAAELAIMRRALRLAGTFTGHTQHRAEVILRGRRYVMDGMKAGVLRQMARSVRLRSFVSATDPPIHYPDHYANIGCSSLVITGGRDRIANAVVTREVFFDRLTATDKTLMHWEPVAHGELEAAPFASQHAYPRVIEWLEQRVTRARV